MPNLSSKLKVKIFADGADLETINELSSQTFIKGFTTNPTLMRRAGIDDYKKFANQAISIIQEKPISFEVFSDDLQEMFDQAIEIASWGKNVNVKIPITNSEGIETTKVINKLSRMGVPLNVTAILTIGQVEKVVEALHENSKAFISIFAGRIADTGRDPIPIMVKALQTMKQKPKSELIWASPRELLNVIQADTIGCHIITATSEILNKLDLIGKDLELYSLETVKMFRKDALASGYYLSSKR
jgi:transaldolase